MNSYLKKLFIALLLVSLTAFSVSCLEQSDSSSGRVFQASTMAPSLSTDSVKNMEHLGSTIMDGGVNFNLYSENATRVELLLFDDPESSDPSQVFVMSRMGNVWTVFVSGIGKGQHYGYRCWGPNWVYDGSWQPGSLAGFVADVDAQGNRFNPNKLLMDPYGRAFHRDHDWSKGSAGSGAHRTQSTLAAAAKTIVVQDGEYQWSSEENTYWNNRKNGTTNVGWEDLIVYEVHVKGFTANLQGKVKYPGTYRGLGEQASYFKELGITAVELMPVHEADAETYWHYMTIGFFAPEVEYAHNPKRGSQIADFKWMVEQLHKNGIEVILDVVYNHTGEGGLWRQKIPNGNYTDPDDIFATGNHWNYDPVELATLYCFRGIDNQTYYGLGDGQGTGNRREYWESTGTGNMIRCNHKAGRRLIIDSLRYWVKEMHVDGFRFDLANTLGRDDANHGNWSPNTLLKDIANDPVLKEHKTRIIAEPWDAQGGSTYHVGEFPKADDYSSSRQAWYEWNDKFRNWMRTFINEDDHKLNSDTPNFGGHFTGNSNLFFAADTWGNDGRAPYHSVNFITAHDGFTLHDLLSYADKRNGAGPLNPDGVDPQSGDNTNHSRDWSDKATKRQMHRNLAVLLFLSHGTPMMLGGDEWMRTKYGNNNTYTLGADNQYNWFRWSHWKSASSSAEMDANSRWRMFDFYKKLINFRKTRKYAFCLTEYPAANSLYSWKDAGNGNSPNWGGEHIAVHFHTVGSGNKQIYICVNMEENDVSFTLPSGLNWEVRLDTQSFYDRDSNTNTTTGNYGVTGSPVAGNTVTGGSSFSVKARSIVVFEEQ